MNQEELLWWQTWIDLTKSVISVLSSTVKRRAAAKEAAEGGLTT